jgi:hypothetical protein
LLLAALFRELNTYLVSVRKTPNKTSIKKLLGFPKKNPNKTPIKEFLGFPKKKTQ